MARDIHSRIVNRNDSGVHHVGDKHGKRHTQQDCKQE